LEKGQRAQGQKADKGKVGNEGSRQTRVLPHSN
jgi:hypothetical protein